MVKGNCLREEKVATAPVASDLPEKFSYLLWVNIWSFSKFEKIKEIFGSLGFYNSGHNLHVSPAVGVFLLDRFKTPILLLVLHV